MTTAHEYASIRLDSSELECLKISQNVRLENRSHHERILILLSGLSTVVDTFVKYPERYLPGIGFCASWYWKRGGRRKAPALGLLTLLLPEIPNRYIHSLPDDGISATDTAPSQERLKSPAMVHHRHWSHSL